MEEIEQIYDYVKTLSEAEIIKLMFLTIDGETYSFDAINVSLDEKLKDATIQEMKKVSERKDFYAFLHSAKGMEFINNPVNDYAIVEAYTKIYMQVINTLDKNIKNGK